MDNVDYGLDVQLGGRSRAHSSKEVCSKTDFENSVLDA